MKHKRFSFSIIFTTSAAAFLTAIALFMAGCPNDNDTENTDTSTNTTDETDGDRMFFIKTAEQTEASGTLCYVLEGSTEIHTVSNKTFAAFFVNPQNSKIVFAEVISGYSGAFIGTMNSDGSDYRQTNQSGSNPCFNNDGDLIYFDDGTDIYTMNPDGTNRQKLEIPGVSGDKRFPRLSPDGAMLAFYQPSPGAKWYYDDVVYLYIFDMTENHVTKLNADSIPVSYLSWSPGGGTIAFSTTIGVTPPVHELWTVKTNGGEEPVRIADSSSPATGACTFPAFIDDSVILCASTKNKILNYRSSWDGDHYKYELAKIGADGTALTIVLQNVSVKNPVWVSD
jgi:Tol biopolymer transport system component